MFVVLRLVFIQCYEQIPYFLRGKEREIHDIINFGKKQIEVLGCVPTDPQAMGFT